MENPKIDPGEDAIFCTRPDWPWGSLILLNNGYRVSFQGFKRPGSGVEYQAPSGAEVRKRVELYLYSPSEPSWPVLGRILPFVLPVPLSDLRSNR